MNQDIRVGPGDAATWGPVTSKQDPRYVGLSATLTWLMTIGLEGARVTVTADVCDDELAKVESVIYEGLNILPALDVPALDDIASHYERHSHDIRRQAELAAQEAAL
ncbi:hypothetical protein [Quisquiliibacterium transsilvanicum]|uniref:Uncharacterized protein n=1 Tax=Quisquiliibacterium transsilvanicum TaxID=1549638 RepID=A0A7W8HGP3_9BURK|nr:hypothetical protein [Quisquiliibacterium transsilvanicum]MBB5271522.1 hypothetical protein [Quisquiliibacterium transsilvanicum]